MHFIWFNTYSRCNEKKDLSIILRTDRAKAHLITSFYKVLRGIETRKRSVKYAATRYLDQIVKSYSSLLHVLRRNMLCRYVCVDTSVAYVRAYKVTCFWVCCVCFHGAHKMYVIQQMIFHKQHFSRFSLHASAVIWCYVFLSINS